jgi:drug/metabolite transporter (DMT)-like permease
MATADLVAGALSVVSALIFTVSFALQQRANLVAMEAGDSGAGAVVARREWIAGMALQPAAFGLQAAALGIGSMIVVETAITTELAFMAPAGAWVLGTRPARRELMAGLVVLVGLAAFVASTRPTDGLDSAPFADWVVPLMVVGVAFVALFALGEGLVDYQAALRGAASGVWGGLMGALTKQMVATAGDGWEALLSGWATWTLLSAGLLSILWVNLSLRAGRLSSSLSAMSSATPVAGLLLAVSVFDERLTGGTAARGVAVAAAVVVAVGISLVARSPSLIALDEAAHTGEPDPAPTPAADSPR